MLSCIHFIGKLNPLPFTNKIRFLTLHRTASFPHSQPNTSKEVELYWQRLYETDTVNEHQILPLGPLIHQNNEPSYKYKDLFIRQSYNEIYNKYITNYSQQAHIFITGSSGVGKSIFRSYMIWRQIQNAKYNKTSCIILMSKSPDPLFASELLLIINGKIMLKKLVIATKIIIRDIMAMKLQTYTHVDISACSNNNVYSNIIHLEQLNHTTFYYVSSDHNTLYNTYKHKQYASTLYIPNWSIDELYHYYISIGCNDVLRERLSHIQRDSKTGLGTAHTGIDKKSHEVMNMSYEVNKDTISSIPYTNTATTAAILNPHPTSTAVDLRHDNTRQLPTQVSGYYSEAEIKGIIQEEAEKYDYCPRDMFIKST